ncbi:hypothetical protein [uncultured Imperialibacter sp.]|uniref:hypothetical protein n=1 Tax=uncultured Imperialibacter sp. TaxID=1672639 RepID=UPI0030DD599F|tara:strand:+ start:16352 stop:17875 length:1524 start_codon:yes stop_codon:yes gene_type:complete
MKAFSQFLKVFVPLSILFAATSCEKEDPSIVPVLVTAEIKAITKTTAIAGGDVSSDGNEEITARGVVWSLAAGPDITLSTKTSEGGSIGSFTSELTELQPGTKYFVRAYATNSVGTAYGNEVTFETLPLQLPVIQTNEATNITFQSATLVGVISSAGVGEVTERGIVYGTTALPTTANAKVSAGTGIGEFSVELIGLEPETKYFARAYGINSDGTSYGSQVTFETSALQSPTVTTGEATEISFYSARAVGTVTSEGTSPVTTRGFVYSTSPNSTTGTNLSVGNGTGSFTADLTGLEPDTKYYIKTFATSSHGTGYGTETSFTTKALVPVPESFSGNWYNVAGTWIWTIAENTTGKYIRTNNVFYYYQPSDVDFADNAYVINGTSSTGATKTAYLKQGADTNKITISTTSATSGFIEYGQVVGRTVKRVTHATGSFQATTGTAWVEKNEAGTITFNFTEISRDDWSVYLRDNDGRGNLQIDVHFKKTFWTPTGGSKAELYPLTGMFNN